MKLTKAQLYLQIATKHTLEGVKAIAVVGTGDGHQGRSHVLEGVMEVPTPNTVGRLWTYLHECVHMRLSRSVRPEGNAYSRIEAEADLEVMRILDEEGVTIPANIPITQPKEGEKSMGAFREPHVNF